MYIVHRYQLNGEEACSHDTNIPSTTVLSNLVAGY